MAKCQSTTTFAGVEKRDDDIHDAISIGIWVAMHDHMFIVAFLSQCTHSVMDLR